MKFIGIDLGWQSGPSGLCCLGSRGLGNDFELHIERLDREATLEGVLDWVDAIAPPTTPALIAVDAPTLIPNETGMRSPDRLAHTYFGKYHAGCYPANQGRPFAERLIQFGRDLESRGFCHAPTIQPQKVGRYQIEVFPHPATIQLFNLPQILKYKKGRLAARSRALGELRNYLLTLLPQHTPPLTAESLPEIPTGGKALKALEDKLDSIVCAYVAAHWWYWGTARNHVLGDGRKGYIVVPCPPSAPVQLEEFD
ncbi:MAG: DUF429 domain-containing protein [Cyanobacteria bacterium J06623_4]